MSRFPAARTTALPKSAEPDPEGGPSTRVEPAHPDGARELRRGTANALGKRLQLRRRNIDAAAGEPLLEKEAAELILLREENAGLKAERHRGPNVGALGESVRALAAASAVTKDQGDDVWDVLTEAMVMREVLMDVCVDIERCMLTLQDRLRPLEPGTLLSAVTHAAGNGNGNGNGNGHAPLKMPQNRIPAPGYTSGR